MPDFFRTGQMEKEKMLERKIVERLTMLTLHVVW